MSDHRNDDVREGLGCILVVVAIFLAVVLFSIADNVISFLEHWLDANGGAA